MENKQTAVEWLDSKLKAVKPSEFCSIETIIEWTQKAKEMEKEQIINAYTDGYDIRDDMGSLSTNPKGKQYYNETYGN